MKPESCDACAACCKVLMLGITGMSGEDVQYFSTVGTVQGCMAVVPMRCKQLKDDKCSIYDTRPKKCHDFALGGPACIALRHALQLTLQETINSAAGIK